MPWQCVPGACLMIPSGSAGEHLFTVVLDPEIIEGYGTEPQVLIVSFTSIKDGAPYDDACEVSPGEHPFITRRSYAYYREPRLEPAAKVEAMVNTGAWRASTPCSAELTRKILAGFKRSKRLPRYFNKLIEDLGVPSS